MGYVEGQSLSHRVAAGPVSAREAAWLVRQIADAIAYAHEHGVIHRDLKPSNVLIDKEGQPRVTDFGLARRVDRDSHLTTTGQVLGTPSYMPPEQAAGRVHEIGPVSDVYGVGAVLYAVLTGRAPFHSDNIMDTLRQVLEQEPVPPRQLNAAVPRDLETICLKCLQKEPRRRYASARELADELDRFLDNVPIQARPIGPLARGWRWCRRNRVVASLGALFVTALIAGIAVSSYYAVIAGKAATVAATARDDAREKLHESLRDQARAGRWSGRPGRRFDSLEAIAKAAAMRPTLELRNEAIACMALADVRATCQWDGVEGEAQNVEPSGDLEAYAASDARGTIRVRRTADQAEIAVLPGDGRQVGTMRFSPDSRYLASGYRDRFRVWDVERRKVQFEVPRVIHHFAAAFSADSRLLAAADAAVLYVYEMPSGKEVAALRMEILPHSLAWHPDGRRLAVSSVNTPRVDIWDTASARLLRSLPHPHPARGVAWHPTSDVLATACADSNVYVWDLASRSPESPRAVLRGHQHVTVQVAFNPAGNLLASNSWDGYLIVWDALRGELLLRDGGFEAVGALLFSADGRRLGAARAGQRFRYWNVASGLERRLLPGDKDQRVWGVGLSSSGRILGVGRSDGLHLWDVATLSKVAHLQIGVVRSVFFQDDAADPCLVTWGNLGLLRWPIRSTAAPQRAGPTFKIGPPENLGLDATPLAEWASMSSDGRVIGLGDRERGQVTVFDLRDRKVRLKVPHAEPSEIAVSPDGRWVASGTWGNNPGVMRVWDVSTGKKVREWAAEKGASVAFDPPSRHLLIGEANAYRRYHVDSWSQQDEIPKVSGVRASAYSPDGRLLAVCPAAGSIRLVDAATLQEVATLPGGEDGVFCFSRDSSQFVSVGLGRTVEVWDLRLLREQLAALDLDWNQPAYPFKPAADATPLRAEVDYGQASPVEASPQPQIMITRPSGARRSVSSGEIAGWIKQIEGDSSALQEKAQVALVEAGLTALKPLNEALAAAKTDDVKGRLEKTLEAIEIGEATAPTLVTAKFDQTPVAQAVAELGKQLPLRLRFQPLRPAAIGAGENRVTLELTETPFLEALDRFSQAAKTSWFNTGDLVVVDRPAEARPHVVYLGNARLGLGALAYHRGRVAEGETPTQEWLSGSMEVVAEPRGSLLGFAAPRIKEATDELGAPLLLSQPMPTYTVYARGDRTSAVAVTMPLRPATGRGKAIRSLRGVLPLEVAVRRRVLAKAEDLANAAGKSFAGSEGAVLTIRSIQRGELSRIDFTLTGVSQPLQASDFVFEVSDARGTAREASLASLTHIKGQVAATIRVALPASAGPATSFTVHRHKRVWVELPFEMRDVPLP
jgi:WD40 repeat protein